MVILGFERWMIILIPDASVAGPCFSRRVCCPNGDPWLWYVIVIQCMSPLGLFWLQCLIVNDTAAPPGQTPWPDEYAELCLILTEGVNVVIHVVIHVVIYV